MSVGKWAANLGSEKIAETASSDGKFSYSIKPCIYGTLSNR